MAKGKTLNPADAYRKALRKKELKKNKTGRGKARDFALVKKDTCDLEDEIARLEAADDASESSRLAELKAELEKINRKKAEYVAEHPEQRRLVYRPRRKEGDKAEEEPVLLKRNLFDKNGLPRHPERSVYYDPVLNPFGVAPPGMPFMQRPPLPGEVWSDEETDDDDDQIPMPKGPPPGLKIEDEDSDDDIPMPEGPRPSLESPMPPHATSLPPLPSPPVSTGAPHPPPPLPPGPPPQNLLSSSSGALPPPALPPPPGFGGGTIPPPPPGMPCSSVPGPPPYAFPNFPPPGFPPPPPGFFPKRNQSSSSIQDPLSSIPHKPFQSHWEQGIMSAHSLLPPNPMRTSAGLPGSASLPQKPMVDRSGAKLSAATVSAAPQLRDLKKEATAFVPAALKRKKPGASGSATAKIDAAPSLGPGTGAETIAPARPDLLSTLQDRFGPVQTAAAPSSKKRKVDVEKNHDYEKFVEDVLGPTK